MDFHLVSFVGNKCTWLRLVVFSTTCMVPLEQSSSSPFVHVIISPLYSPEVSVHQCILLADQCGVEYPVAYIPASVSIWLLNGGEMATNLPLLPPKVHVYLPLHWQALINHCYLPMVAHAAFVLHTMRAFLHDGYRQFVSSGAAGGWCSIHM